MLLDRFELYQSETLKDENGNVYTEYSKDHLKIRGTLADKFNGMEFSSIGIRDNQKMLFITDKETARKISHMDRIEPVKKNSFDKWKDDSYTVVSLAINKPLYVFELEKN